MPVCGCSWDALIDPITLDTVPYEQATVVELIATDNVVFNKVLRAITAVMGEIRELCAMAPEQFYGPLCLYGEGLEDAKVEDGDVQV